MASTGVFIYSTSSIWLIVLFAALTVYSAVDAVRHWGDWLTVSSWGIVVHAPVDITAPYHHIVQSREEKSRHEEIKWSMIRSIDIQLERNVASVSVSAKDGKTYRFELDFIFPDRFLSAVKKYNKGEKKVTKGYLFRRIEFAG